MTNEDRLKAFVEAYNLLVQQFGVGFVARLKPEMLGEVAQIRPVLDTAIVENWQPKEEVNNHEIS